MKLILALVLLITVVASAKNGWEYVQCIKDNGCKGKVGANLDKAMDCYNSDRTNQCVYLKDN